MIVIGGTPAAYASLRNDKLFLAQGSTILPATHSLVCIPFPPLFNKISKSVANDAWIFALYIAIELYMVKCAIYSFVLHTQTLQMRLFVLPSLKTRPFPFQERPCRLDSICPDCIRTRLRGRRIAWHTDIRRTSVRFFWLCIRICLLPPQWPAAQGQRSHSPYVSPLRQSVTREPSAHIQPSCSGWSCGSGRPARPPWRQPRSGRPRSRRQSCRW